MFVTRPRSLYRKFHSAALIRPPLEAPYSGVLVVSDDQSEEMDSSCFGLCKNKRISSLPFPQDRFLNVVNSANHHEAKATKVWFIPVPEQPLSSNRYFIIKAKGKYKGKAYTCSREPDIETCCFNHVSMDLKPKRFDHRDVYQHFEIRPYQGGTFYALPVAVDGCPPKFLRRRGWQIYTAHSYKLPLREARGLHTSSLSQLPELEVPVLFKRSTPVTIGEWYCPFTFIKERFSSIRHQMESSPFYELSLNQWWEEIYYCKNEDGTANGVLVFEATIKKLVAMVYGIEAEKDNRERSDEFVWFKAKEGSWKEDSVGLSSAVFGKLRLVQQGRGWFEGGVEDVRVQGREEIPTESGWSHFCCYVLVESFVFRKMDGSLLINFSFKNPNRIRCKWG